MKIVPLKTSDSKIIAEFFAQNFSDGWTESMLISSFNSGRFYALGVTEGEQLVATITFSLSDDSADIEDIVVKIDKRRRGIAKWLLASAEEKIKEYNKQKIFLEVREGNAPAIALYEALGYKTINVRKRYYSDGENAKVMCKEI